MNVIVEHLSGNKCNNVYVDHVRGESVCLDTGEVIDSKMIIEGRDWRSYSTEEWLRRAHVENITSAVHDYGLATSIDISSRKLIERLKFARLSAVQRETRVSKSDKKLVDALSKLNRVASLLDLPSEVRETSAQILRRIISNLKPRKHSVDAYIAVSIVLAARKHRIKIRAKDAISILGVSEAEYWKALSDVSFNLGAFISNFKEYLDPREFIPSIVNKLNVSYGVELVASKIVSVLKEAGYTEGKDPAGIAAAAVYIASIVVNEKKTQREVAEASNVTEVTIRNRYREIIDKILIEVYV